MTCGSKKCEKGPPAGLAGKTACPTNSTPGLVKVSELSACHLACERSVHSDFQKSGILEGIQVKYDCGSLLHPQ